jgi:hypothetical protein
MPMSYTCTYTAVSPAAHQQGLPALCSSLSVQLTLPTKTHAQLLLVVTRAAASPATHRQGLPALCNPLQLLCLPNSHLYAQQIALLSSSRTFHASAENPISNPLKLTAFAYVLHLQARSTVASPATHRQGLPALCSSLQLPR